MACNSLQWFKWLSGKHKKKQKEKETLTHYGVNHFQWEILQLRHNPSGCGNARLQEQKQQQQSATMAASACPGVSSPHCQWKAASSTTGRGRQSCKGKPPGTQRFRHLRSSEGHLTVTFQLAVSTLCCIITWCDWYLTWESLTGFSCGSQKFTSKSLQVALMQARSIPSYSDWFGFQWHTEA